MKKISLLLLVMTLIITSFSLTTFAVDAPSITMEYKEFSDGKVVGTIYLNSDITTDFAGYSVAISWKPGLVKITKNVGNNYELITTTTAADTGETFVDKSTVGALNNWGTQTTSVNFTTNYFQIGSKDLSNPQVNNIAIDSNTKLELAKVYFKLADGVTTLDGESPFDSYLKTSMPAVTSQINYGVNGTTTIKTSATVNFFTFTNITDYTPVSEEPVTGKVYDKDADLTADNTGVTFSGTIADIQGSTIEAGLHVAKLAAGEVEADVGSRGAKLPALEDANTVLKGGKFAVNLVGFNELPAGSNFLVRTYVTVDDSTTYADGWVFSN